ncbi:MAG: LamG-like jellyroll fold domain-containing protein [Bacteroidota bacterium]
MTAIIVALLIFCFGLLVYKNKSRQLSFKSNDFSIPELLLISSATSFLLYKTFFYFSEHIRSFNIKIPHEQFIPPARAASYEFDGIEGYVLYSLMFVNIILSFIFAQFLSSTKNKVIYLSVFLIFVLASSAYVINIGFIPAMTNYPDYKDINPFLIIVVLMFTGLLFLMYNYLNGKLFLGILAVVLLPICFISTDVISVFDYSFILSPALRLINGAPLSDIYFQYDLFLSLLAALWMKLNIDLNLFQLLGQLSFYLLFIGIFIFSKKFFINKKLSLFLLISLLIVRYYAIMHEPVAIFQVTPLRLDLWLILLVLVYYKGAYHWLNAIVIGLLLMFHKNFGLLYLLAYVQFIITLFIIEFIELASDKARRIELKGLLKKHFFLNLKNILIIAGFVIGSIILFKGFIPKSALLYQQIGVGMIQISTKSFYWYIPVMFSLGFILLIKLRNVLSKQYFQSGLFVIFIAIGNSIYFFGRSHEHNILNIATALLFILFLLFDILGNNFTVSEPIVKQKTTKKNNPDSVGTPTYLKLQKTIISILPILFITGAAYFYSEKTGQKIKTQYRNFKNSQYIYPLTVPTDFASLKKITNNSDSVYFLNYQDDFLYYYYGQYKPVGYFNPCATWILKNDMLNFLQNLLDNNYYIVTTKMREIAELLPDLKYNNVSSEKEYTAISKKKVELLFSESTVKPLVHIGIGSDLGNNGINLTPIALEENFTIEVLLKPKDTQVDNASVLVNAITDSIGPSGMTFQQNGPNDNEFLFAYGGGKEWTPPAFFKLQPNEWNYIVISVKENTIKVFNNALLVYTAKSAFSIKNINAPIVIGNGIGINNAFNGLLKEVKITNDTISEQTVSTTLKMIKDSLK